MSAMLMLLLAAADAPAGWAWRPLPGQCVLEQRGGAGPSADLAVQMRPGESGGALLLTPLAPPRKIKGRPVRYARLVIGPIDRANHHALRAGAYAVRDVRIGLDPAMMAALEKVEQIDWDGTTYRLGAMAAALSALRACAADLAQVGQDAATPATLVQPLATLPVFLHMTGRETKLLRFVVNADATVGDCWIVGQPLIVGHEAALCRMAIRHGRFQPARRADGRPVAALLSADPLIGREKYWDGRDDVGRPIRPKVKP